MQKPEQNAPPTISLKSVAEEIGMLPSDDCTAYLNRRTGELYTVTADDQAALDDPDDPLLPDWQRDALLKTREVTGSADWVVLPSKFDLHEHAIMKRFCLGLKGDRQRETLLDVIHRKGAFRRFKDLAHRYGIQQQWYDFRDREMQRLVADWLETKGIAYER